MNKSALACLCLLACAPECFLACAPELEDKEVFLAKQVADGVPGAADGASAPSCAPVPELLAATCATATCHSARDKAESLDLESPDVPRRLSGVPAVGGAGMLIDPSSPERSVLYTKLSSAPPFGGRMPSNGAPLDPSAVACVRAWLSTVAAADAGSAPDGGGTPDAAGADAGAE